MSNVVDWSAFGWEANNSAEEAPSAYNDAVGRAFFDPGWHDVTIEGVEGKVSKAGNQYISLTLKREDGAQIKSSLFLRDKSNPNEPHFTYARLSKAICADYETRIKFFETTLSANPHLLPSLVGMQVRIKVEEGDTGYLIKKDASGLGFKLVDAETNEVYEETAEEMFEGYKDARERAEELMLTRCYNEVKAIVKGDEDAVARNEEAIQKILRATEAGEDVVTKPKSAARRPAI